MPGYCRIVNDRVMASGSLLFGLPGSNMVVLDSTLILAWVRRSLDRPITTAGEKPIGLESGISKRLVKGLDGNNASAMISS